MKNLLAFIFATTVILSLSGCGKSEAAVKADDLISKIGTVTLNSESDITNAEQAIHALEEKELADVEKITELESARTKYEQLLTNKLISEIEATISNIGTVNLESHSAIETARKAYDACSDDIKVSVKNYDQLVTAEQTIKELEINAKVEKVVTEIEEIGSVTVNSSDKIDLAKKSYDALADEYKSKVSNASILEAAIEELKSLKKEMAEKGLSQMQVQEDRVRGLKFYYPSTLPLLNSSQWRADLRSFVLPYIGTDGNNFWLRILSNYTSNDWLFFEKMTFAVDDARYTKSFSYHEVVRDNGGGDIWEYVDIIPSESDIEMLYEIANSTETIIRFEGDEYYDDITINNADKNAIRDTLDTYNALIN